MVTIDTGRIPNYWIDDRAKQEVVWSRLSIEPIEDERRAERDPHHRGSREPCIRLRGQPKAFAQHPVPRIEGPRWIVIAPFDRRIQIPDQHGLADVVVRDSKQATLVGEYWNAVHAHLAKGESSGLRRFEGKHVITANGERVSLLADPDVLDELGNAGVLSFESIYARGR